MVDKALVKKTGEILDVKSHYFTKQISISLPGGMKLPKEWTDKFSYEQEDIAPSDHYILSDGNKYDEDELVVGIDNIRDYKITNQIKINE